MKIKINENWTFRKEGGLPAPVTLPHDAMLYERRDPACGNGVNSGYYPGGRYIYEKNLTLTEAEIDGKMTELYFEGVYRNAKVFCNGIPAAEHAYGFTPFYADLTGKIRPGPNLIRVTVDNSLEPNCRWYSGSGIYRSVYLLVRNPNCIGSVRVRTLSVEPAVVRVEAEQTGRGEMTCIVCGPGTELKAILPPEESTQNREGKTACGAELTLERAELWSPEHPTLYTCTVSNGTDTVTVRFGIRTIVCSAETGLLLNGREILLRGGCIHADHGILGAKAWRDLEYRRVRILKEAGYNAVRCAHNPASADFLDACDELGMLVLNEAFDGWYIPKTYHDYSRVFAEHWQEDISAMVEVDHNHPSVIMRSLGNEISETAEEKGVLLAGEMAAYLHRLDPSRPVTAGINVLINVYAGMGIGIYRDTKDYRAEPLPARKAGYREKKTGSAFFNALTQKLGPLMFCMSAGRKGDRAVRDTAEQLDILGLNYAASRYDQDLKKYPSRAMLGTETIISELPYNWERVRKHKAVIGDFAWAAWDYLGEAGVGDYMYYSYAGLPLLAGSGAIDILGTVGPEAAFQQVVWGLRSVPYLCVSPLNHSGETPKKSAWRFTDGIDSWNWPGYEGKKTKAEVYTDAPKVRLYLNGRLLEEKRVKNFRAVFRTTYEPGELKAVAVYPDRQKETRLVTGSGSGKLTAAVAWRGEEITLIEIAMRDQKGMLLPAAEVPVRVICGEGVELLGLGSARTKTDDSYISDRTHLYRGRAMAAVRGSAEASCLPDGTVCLNRLK